MPFWIFDEIDWEENSTFLVFASLQDIRAFAIASNRFLLLHTWIDSRFFFSIIPWCFSFEQLCILIDIHKNQEVVVGDKY